MNISPSRLFLYWLLLPAPVLAGWSGVSLSIGDETIPIVNGDELLVLTPFSLSLQVEDKTSSDLRIGAHFEKLGVKASGSSLSIDADGEAVGLYLYYPYQFNEAIGIISRVAISLIDASSPSTTDKETGVDYVSKEISLGLALKWQNFRVIPSINARSIKGDVSLIDANSSFSFEQEKAVFTSLLIDYFVDQNSFIRFATTEHSDNTFSISFSTIY